MSFPFSLEPSALHHQLPSLNPATFILALKTTLSEDEITVECLSRVHPQSNAIRRRIFGKCTIHLYPRLMSFTDHIIQQESLKDVCLEKLTFTLAPIPCVPVFFPGAKEVGR
jgi:hypothetical protein